MDLETQTEQGGSGPGGCRGLILMRATEVGYTLPGLARHHRLCRHGLPEWRTAGGHPGRTPTIPMPGACPGGPILLAQGLLRWNYSLLYSEAGPRRCSGSSRGCPRTLRSGSSSLAVQWRGALSQAPATCFSYSADQWLQSTFTADPGDCTAHNGEVLGTAACREVAATGYASAGVKRWAFQACQPIAVDYVWTKPKPKFPKASYVMPRSAASMCSSRPWTLERW